MQLRHWQKFISSGYYHRSNITVNNCREFCSGHTSSTSHPIHSTSEDHYDVVVAGGGMVGFAMACALGQSRFLSNCRVLLLESQPCNDHPDFPEQWHTAPHSNRVSAIAPQSAVLLEKLGAWQLMKDVRMGSLTRMQVWESECDSFITFGNGQRNLAHIIENDLIVEALKRRVPNGVDVRYSNHAEGYTLPSTLQDKARVHLKGDVEITTDLLIGCDGMSSLVRQAMGGQYLTYDYGTTAVVATLELEQEEEGEYESNTMAWQKFLPTGPVALLPLQHGLSSLVWSTTTAHAEALLALDPHTFTDQLNSALWSSNRATPGSVTGLGWLREVEQRSTHFIRRAGEVLSGTTMAQVSCKQLPPSVCGVLENSRAAFPLSLGHAVHYAAPRVVLLGDAAHRIHPLAGQGVNLGFGDVAELTKVLELGAAEGEDIGNTSRLYEYETTRQRHNMVLMAATHGLHHLYCTAAAPVVLLRSLGLSAVDALKPLKDRIEAIF